MVTRTEFQALLDRMAMSFVENDFDSYADCVTIPLTIVAHRGVLHYPTREDLATMFQDYVTGLKINAVDSIVRSVTSFDDCMDGSYIGNAETHFLHAGRRIAEPHTSAFLATMTDDGLRIQSVLGSRAPQEAARIAPTVWEI